MCAVLRATAFSVPIEPYVGWQPDFDNEDFSQLRVVVVPRAISKTVISRGRADYECGVDVGIFRFVSPENLIKDGQMDELMGFVEEVVIAMDKTVLQVGNEQAYSIDPTRVDPLYNPDYLRKHHLFASVVSLTFKVVR